MSSERLNDEETNSDDITIGYTGDLRLGQLIVKEGDDPFLHGHCAKRQWHEKVCATDSLSFLFSKYSIF